MDSKTVQGNDIDWGYNSTEILFACKPLKSDLQAVYNGLIEHQDSGTDPWSLWNGTNFSERQAADLQKTSCSLQMGDSVVLVTQLLEGCFTAEAGDVCRHIHSAASGHCETSYLW